MNAETKNSHVMGLTLSAPGALRALKSGTGPPEKLSYSKIIPIQCAGSLTS